MKNISTSEKLNDIGLQKYFSKFGKTRDSTNKAITSLESTNYPITNVKLKRPDYKHILKKVVWNNLNSSSSFSAIDREQRCFATRNKTNQPPLGFYAIKYSVPDKDVSIISFSKQRDRPSMFNKCNYFDNNLKIINEKNITKPQTTTSKTTHRKSQNKLKKQQSWHHIPPAINFGLQSDRISPELEMINNVIHPGKQIKRSYPNEKRFELFNSFPNNLSSIKHQLIPQMKLGLDRPDLLKSSNNQQFKNNYDCNFEQIYERGDKCIRDMNYVASRIPLNKEIADKFQKITDQDRLNKAYNQQAHIIQKNSLISMNKMFPRDDKMYNVTEMQSRLKKEASSELESSIESKKYQNGFIMDKSSNRSTIISKNDSKFIKYGLY